MTATRLLFLLFLLTQACGRPSPEPEEVTTTVTEGDEEAWSEPDDPPIANEAAEDEPAGDATTDP